MRTTTSLASSLISSLVFVLLGCGGPQQNRHAETPTARTPRTPYEAPAASSSDREREQGIRQFDDMHDGQQAHEEANRPAANPPPTPPPGAQPPPGAPPGMSPPPKKVGPAEQAPMPPKK